MLAGEGEDASDIAAPAPMRRSVDEVDDVPGEGKDVGRDASPGRISTSPQAKPRADDPEIPEGTNMVTSSPCAKRCATPWPRKCASTNASS